MPLIPGISGGAGGLSASSSASSRSGSIGNTTSFSFMGQQRKADYVTPALIVGAALLIGFSVYKRVR